MNYIVVLLGILFFTTSLAQTPVDTSKTARDVDYFMMKNGFIYHYITTGEVETVMSNATLLNGIVITSRGLLLSKNGESKQLNSGQCVNAEGLLQPCSTLDSLLSIEINRKKK